MFLMKKKTCVQYRTNNYTTYTEKRLYQMNQFTQQKRFHPYLLQGKQKYGSLWITAHGKQKNGHMDHCTWQRNNPMDHFARGRQNTSNNIFLRLQIAENQPALWVSSHVRPTISEILRQFALFTSFMLNKSRVRQC